MSRDGFATPPSHSRRAPLPRVLRTAGELLLDDSETLVVHLLSGGSFVLHSAALREAGATCTVEIRRFVAFKLGVMPYQAMCYALSTSCVLCNRTIEGGC